jgi:hypothetical protein
MYPYLLSFAVKEKVLLVLTVLLNLESELQVTGDVYNTFEQGKIRHDRKRG